MTYSAKARQRRQFIPAMAAAALAILLHGCSGPDEDGPINVAAIGEIEPAADLTLASLSSPSLTFFDATAQGLIGFDGSGQIEPGLGERWTVTSDGRSYIFRIKEAEWPNGKRVTAQQVATILRSYIAPDSRHPLARDFVEVEEIHAMTDEVIEIRLSVPQPMFLELLAQPSMAIVAPTKALDRGWGPMRVQRLGAHLRFTPILDPLLTNGEISEEDPAYPSGSIDMLATNAPRALARFQNGYADAVIGGDFRDIFYFDHFSIPRSRLQIDPVAGLFGLVIKGKSGFLAEAKHRAILSSLIRRERLLEVFAISEWSPQRSLIPAVSRSSSSYIPSLPDWTERSESENLAVAQRLVAEWKDSGATIAPIRIFLPVSLGSNILFAYITADFRRAGLEAERVKSIGNSDVYLIDEITPNDDPIWALRRLNCRLNTPCNVSVETQVQMASLQIDADRRMAIIAAAETELLAFSPFIPLVTPLRWSVSSQRLTGLTPNIRAHHPLNRLIAAPK